ncbi:MAG: DUF4080 domain-containing protein [Lachnospiraceae bacterium]|nr:DUF4080 domain-containing protein [Lachnospiraceae bacterium]
MDTKILLVAVNAKYIHPCPAVYSLSASCGHPESVEIAEFTINDRYQDILDEILEWEAALIGFSSYIWNTEILLNLAADIRRVRRDAVILFAGGPEASYAPERFLAVCDFVVCGEGEVPFNRIMDLAADVLEDHPSGMMGSPRSLAALKAEILANVPGLVFRPGTYKGFRSDKANACENADLDSIPFPYKDLAAFANRIIYYESSRGCPFRCTYCLSSIDKRVRFRSLDKVYEELQFFLDREVPQVKFIDRTFNCSPDRAKAIWTFLKEHDNGITNFHFEIGADLLGEEELALLETLRPGQVQLEIGIQSTNPETLLAINRTANLPRLFENIRHLRRANNMHLHVDLIAGLPYEGLRAFAKSFNDVYALHADQLQLGFLKVLGGTVMQEKAAEYDIRYSQRPPYEVLSTKWLTYGELAMLRRIDDVLEYYYNSGQFRHALGYIEGYWESAFAFYRDLAGFFRQKGYDRERPAAARRYEVLAEFVESSCSAAGDRKGYGSIEGNGKILDGIAGNVKSRFDFAVFREYLRFDRDLHIHRSRRRKVVDEYDFGEGKVRLEIDYEHRDVITGEAGFNG